MKVKMIATGKVEDYNESYARRLYCAGLAVLAEDADGGNGADDAENASGDSLPGSNPALIFPEGNAPAASDATGADAEPSEGGEIPADDGKGEAAAEPLAVKTDKPGKGRKSR